ncbi:type II toxin-antitoxin system HicA family toxin [Mesorhizobium sp. WSM4310]|nr:type II toxin-antitoxin system HicA family toxin [Mesorhizobium sp. WSM4310]
MARLEKLKLEFKACDGPYSYRDTVTLLRGLGYTETSTGGGSRRRFVRKDTGHIIRLHEPHPGNEIPPYMVRQIRDSLIERNEL